MLLFRRLILGVALTMMPVAAVLLASPVALSVLQAPERIGPWGVALALPFCVAILAAPGFLDAAFGRSCSEELSAARRRWVRASLGAGIACSVVGMLMGLLFVVPSFGALVSVVCVFLKFESRKL
jgi:hypothetical protein